MSRRVTTSLLAALLVGLGLASSAAGALPHQQVHYLGNTISVPGGWPVVDLVRHPHSCVRFDRHAVYLGHPGTVEACPVSAIGRTEALLLQPLAHARDAEVGTSFHRGRALVTATWRRDPAVIRRVLGLRSLPAPPARTAAAASAASRVAHTAAVTTGLGFDPCATPSEATMRAWSSSPYRTVGVYLGGVNAACSQPNLTARWVSDETAAGWHFIPTYVGLQAPGTSCGCRTIDGGSARSEGAAEAADAISRARSVGMGTGNPIYFDMEAYTTGGSATRTALTFLSGWTAALHAAGYLSGVYSSAASGITDLVGAFGSRQYLAPDDIWVADWNNRHTVADPYVPSGDWANHQRIHQFNGGADVTYGGVTLNIDGDYVDGAVATAGSLIPDGTFVQVAGGTALWEVAGGAPLPVTDWTPFGGPQKVRTLTAAQFAQLPAVPIDGTFLRTPAGAAYRVAGGALFPVTDWGLFGGHPQGVTIDPADITLAGTTGSHLNHAPAPGTVVEGLPSDTYWQFGATGRGSVPVTAGAVGVEDAALTPFPIAAAPAPRCVVPKLYRLSLSRARSALNRAHCTVGVIHAPRHLQRGHELRVQAQRPAPGALRPAGHTVNLALL